VDLHSFLNLEEIDGDRIEGGAELKEVQKLKDGDGRVDDEVEVDLTKM